MKIFLDTAEVSEIKQYLEYGVVDGVTTNPSLIAKAGRKHRDVVEEICGLIDGPVSAEVVATEFEEMVKEARELHTWADNVVVKLPFTRNGQRALHVCHQEGIPVNITLIFSVNQALLACKAGATFISPFVGRLDDIGHDGMALVRQCVDLTGTYDFDTEVLAASLRHPVHVMQALEAGSDVGTLPPKVLDTLFNHPLTDIGLEKFLEDYRKSQQG